ncbi:hypothetical protein EJB05_25280, partial [Eragrostis curvula]
MGKHEFLTPKAIANRIKAKGLQKLRWYCQMCQKQCRDENGFKCHCMSESHQRQMQVFGQAPDRVVEGFSEEFLESFLALIRRAHRHSRVAATVVYNEYIADRHHVHMNSTRWATLTEFVKFLGREGYCKVEDTPKGWFMTYIDRDSEQAVKARLKRKRIKSDLVEEERQERMIARQIERAQKSQAKGSDGDDGNDAEYESESESGSEEEYSGSDNVQDDSSKEANKMTGRIAIALQKAAPGPKVNPFEDKPKVNFGFDEEEDVAREKEKGEGVKKGKDVKASDARKSALDELMKEEEKAKERSNRKDYWLCPGIVVKVMSKSLVEKGYYKQKGVVKRVTDKYVGEIEMLESKHVLKVDQDELETVIPQIGGLVRIVNGAYRGSNARLLSVDTEKFCAKVQVEKGLYDGKETVIVDAPITPFISLGLINFHAIQRTSYFWLFIFLYTVEDLSAKAGTEMGAQLRPRRGLMRRQIFRRRLRGAPWMQPAGCRSNLPRWTHFLNACNIKGPSFHDTEIGMPIEKVRGGPVGSVLTGSKVFVDKV